MSTNFQLNIISLSLLFFPLSFSAHQNKSAVAYKDPPQKNQSVNAAKTPSNREKENERK